MTTRTMPPHLAHLPVRNGLPVPWVASWTGEQVDGLIDYQVTSRGVVVGRGMIRQHGMAWIDVGMMRMGMGEPDFGATSSHRQRRSMRGRCQVCGHRIEGAPWWIIPREGGWVEPTNAAARDLETKQPPVCRACLDTAPLWCPHLRHGAYEVVQAVATPVAAAGDQVTPTGTEPGYVVDLDDPLRVWVIGRELIVHLTPVGEIVPGRLHLETLGAKHGV